MTKVLPYPFTSIPLPLCHMGRLKQTAPKVKLLYELESRIQNDVPPNVE